MDWWEFTYEERALMSRWRPLEFDLNEADVGEIVGPFAILDVGRPSRAVLLKPAP